MTRVALVAALLLSSACSGKLDRDALLDPETCKTCHPRQYREWSGSMHAYAAADPVFRAMNARGQRETQGALGDFCVKCHAPMAVRDGLTTDGLNLDEVPQKYRGVTCFFCHQVAAVEGDHNAALRLSEDLAMRGSFADAIESDAHETVYSALHDRSQLDSSQLCGSCHDIVTPANVHLERTFAEWKGSLFSKPTSRESLSCAACHMPGQEGAAADVEGVPLRRVKDHMMPGVDVALEPFPELEAQRAAVQRELDTTLLAQLCVLPTAAGLDVDVDLESVATGHHWPTGAAQDRRAWVELIATTGGVEVFSSGKVADGGRLADLQDPNLWRFGDRLFDGAGNEVHMFWEAERVESSVLPAATSRDPTDPAYTPTHVLRRYTIPTRPDEIRLRVRMQPMGLDVLDDLIASGDLDPAIREVMPTFDLAATVLTWRAADGELCVPRR